MIPFSFTKQYAIAYLCFGEKPVNNIQELKPVSVSPSYWPKCVAHLDSEAVSSYTCYLSAPVNSLQGDLQGREKKEKKKGSAVDWFFHST